LTLGGTVTPPGVVYVFIGTLRIVDRSLPDSREPARLVQGKRSVDEDDLVTAHTATDGDGLRRP